jgi:hypothetical protein
MSWSINPQDTDRLETNRTDLCFSLYAAAGSVILLPFDFKMCEVKLDFSRLTKCLKEMNKLWNADRPPAGKDGCKDCALLTRLCDFEQQLRITDAQAYAAFPGQAQWAIQQDYFRRTTRTSRESLQDLLAEDPWDQEGGMWANWQFS